MKPNGGPRFTEPERVEQRIEALRLWMSGAKYATIAARLDISSSTAYQRVQDAIDEMRPHADFDRYRSVQLAEIDIARRPLRTMIATWRPGDDHRPVVDAIAALLKLQVQEGQLVGLDRVETPPQELQRELAALSDEELAEMVKNWAVEVTGSTPVSGNPAE